MPDDYTFVGDDAGMTPAEYGYLWIKDCCLMHQWCSGARPVDQEVVDYCESLVEDVRKNVHGEGQPDYDWDEHDLQNIETLLRYLKANLGEVEEKDGLFQTSDLGTITYSRVMEAHPEPYEMKLRGSSTAVLAQAILVGIDSHLEACFVEERGDKCLSQQVAHIATLNDEKVIAPYYYSARPNFLDVAVSAKSLPVLLRRLFELEYDGDINLQDEARSLADDILESIGLGDA